MDIKSLSELIEYLELIKIQHGDISVYGTFMEHIEDFSDLISVNEFDEDDTYIEIG